MALDAHPEEKSRRDFVVGSVLEAVRADQKILLPHFDAELSRPGPVAPVAAGLEPNSYGGTVGIFRYQFEGEDDLLHLMVVRLDQTALSVEEAQAVFTWLLPDLPSGLVWVRPGEYSQHFYFGHDELLRSQNSD